MSEVSIPASDSFAEGAAMHNIVRELFPLCRSITGPGLRETIRRIGRRIPLNVHEVPSGTPVLDWTVPDEWTIRGAWIEKLDGRRLVDFDVCNLHVVGYSRPVDAVLTREELARHVHTLPDQPDLVPYHTGFFADSWGFCLSHAQWQSMTDPAYRVVVDSTVAPGSLTYGDLLVPGRSREEVLIHAHCCHPSLANDNLSGIVVATWLARRVLARPNRLSYRFVFVPATIGAISWLARNEATLDRIRHGLVLSCVGDPGTFHYKRSRRGDTEIDRAVVQVCRDRGLGIAVRPFRPMGYDERQYCSPGFDLPVGCFMRTPNGEFPEYHTSADNPDLVRPEALQQSYEVLAAVMDLLEANLVYRRVDGRGEPQLGRRGLFRRISAEKHATGQEALLWLLNLADGTRSLLDMAEHTGLSFTELNAAAELARDAELIVEAE
ncbi:DUF4910 domain-containing protein [Indioceanicola profundi]|uniref:DUF4910 domain-containing protein n=1 Tax=Indioceanicola profundi TaxID=2220096 RepID=UPI000E6A9C76|nr:DUF4910 domain-containing protein [Indioceanicola profundi]